MSLVRKIKDLWRFYFTEQAADRSLFQAIQEQAPRSILELGVGNLERSLKMIEFAQRSCQQVSFTGVDLFESRPPHAPGVTLRLAYRELRATKANVRLIPGDPYSALSRSANQVTQVDLVVVAADQDADSMTKAWFYLPRMLGEKAHVFREELATSTQPRNFREITREELASLAVRPARRAA